MSFLFGPVNSRRLGLSLGVDIIPYKTCTFDCIYCELGRTTDLTLERRPFQVEAIIREIREYFQNPPTIPDYVTLAGSGEPTLNTGIGEILKAVKETTPRPAAVLTNGSLLYRPEVRQALALADVVLPSLDAAREETFHRLNRPAPGLNLPMILTGLKTFRQEYAGRIWLEIMLLKGINDQEDDLAALKREIEGIAPDRIQLNTAVRPVAESWAQPLSRSEMEAVAAYLGAGAEIIAAFDRPKCTDTVVTDITLVNMLSRRPMTAQDLASALRLPLPQVEKHLHRLLAAGLISRDLYQNKGFYRSEPQARVNQGHKGP
jgi:wyosine [tRNA(Phe)-imidazoG37] synthetase (radical SAM superfamily)